MKRALILTLLVGCLLPLTWANQALAVAPACPDYVVGYRGTVFFCLIPGLNIPAIGAVATVSTAEGQICAVPVGYDGTYECKITTNNCPPQPFYSYPQAWGVVIDLAPSFLGIGTHACDTAVTFLCCCPTCYQEVVEECSFLFPGPCCP